MKQTQCVLSCETPKIIQSLLSISSRSPENNGNFIFTSPILISLFLLLSVPLVLFLSPQILTPRHLPVSLQDQLDDLSLFRRAAGSTQSTSHPSSVSHWGSSKPKIAFLFLTNSNLHFAPLWERFFDNNRNLYNIYVHEDPFTKGIEPLTGVFANRSIVGKRTERSSPTLIAAARRLIATAILDDPANMFFALVSQHCIPLHSFRFTYCVLFSSPTIEASNIIRTPSVQPSYIEILSDEPLLWERYVARGKDVMLPEVKFSQFRVGSQFFVLNRRHALLVIEERKLWKKFSLPCHSSGSCFPEEHYFPTLLSMKDPMGCSHYTLTRVNWTDTVDGHPHTYMQEEVSPKLIYDLRKSNSTYSYLFARKFSPASLNRLMRMVDTVIFRD